jgi:predicted nucleic acid-binding protein
MFLIARKCTSGCENTVVALDFNLLIYALCSEYAEHVSARRAVQRAADNPRGFGVPLPCVAELWNIVTQPPSVIAPATPAEVGAFLEALVEGGAVVWHPSAGFWRRLVQLATELRVSGVRVFDLQIALIAFENGATEIWTHDRNFTRVPGLRVHDPL